MAQVGNVTLDPKVALSESLVLKYTAPKFTPSTAPLGIRKYPASRIQRFITFVLYLFLGACSVPPESSWHMINVNYGRLPGDAHLLETGTQVVMIDAGSYDPAKKVVVPYLQKLGIDKIDHLFISHPHRDHYGGLRALAESGIEIDSLYFKIPAPGVTDKYYDKDHFLKYIDIFRNQGTDIIEVESGFKLHLGTDSEIEILHAQEGNLGEIPLDVNDMSLIMKWRVDKFSILFTGDLNHRLGKYLTGDPRMKADFLKVPHHGISGIAPNSFFDTVNPEYALVPGLERKWCGERGKQAREWAKSKKIPTWVNGINGHIEVNFRDSEATITPEIVSQKCQFKAFAAQTFSKANM